MKIGILKAFESFELSILKYDTKTKKYKSNKDNQSSKKYLINRPFPKHRPHQLNI